MKADSQKKKGKFMTFLNSICSPYAQRDEPPTKNVKKTKHKITKTPRLTFSLDRVLVKLSRKNIAEEEFMQGEVLTFHLEKYLANRLKIFDVVLFDGEFSSIYEEHIPYTIYSKFDQSEACLSGTNYLISKNNPSNGVKFRGGSIDVMAFQFYMGENKHKVAQTSSSTKCSKKTVNSIKTDTSVPKKQQAVSNTSLQNIDQIESTLRLYGRSVGSFIFICHPTLEHQQIHNLFVMFKEKFLFEVEKVKIIEKTVCIIVYASVNPKFLRIDNNALCEFLMAEFEKLKVFEMPLPIVKKSSLEKKKQIAFSSMKQREDEKYRKTLQKILVGAQLADKNKFRDLLFDLLQSGLHIPVSLCLGHILSMSEKHKNITNWFLDMVYERAPSSRELIEVYQEKDQRLFEDEETKSVCNTPAFEVNIKDSQLTAKHTAIFRDSQLHNSNSNAVSGEFVSADTESGQTVSSKKESLDPKFSKSDSYGLIEF